MEVQKRTPHLADITPPMRRSSRQEAKLEKLKLAAEQAIKQEKKKKTTTATTTAAPKPSKAKRPVSVSEPTSKAKATNGTSTKAKKEPAKKAAEVKTQNGVAPKSTKRKSSSASPEEPAPKKASKVAKAEPGQAKSESGAKTLEVGSLLPNVELVDQDGQSVNLKKIARESGKTIVLFAYPKASTPGCTKQACGFRDHYKDFEKGNALVFGISADPPKAQNSFKTKQSLPYQLLSDPEYKLIGPLGAKKSPKGVVRSHWIFKGGKLVESAVGISPNNSFTNALSSI